MNDDLKKCFTIAKKEEEKGIKHKGLLVVKPNMEEAKNYLERAKESLKFCELYKKIGADYKIPEEWFYCLYYCGLAILAKFGVESRSQKCTALFLKYLQENKIILYNEEFVKRIIVYKEKGKESDVDEREKARYGSWIRSREVEEKFDNRMNLCRKAIEQATEIVFSPKETKLPKELIE